MRFLKATEAIPFPEKMTLGKPLLNLRMTSIPECLEIGLSNVVDAGMSVSEWRGMQE